MAELYLAASFTWSCWAVSKILIHFFTVEDCILPSAIVFKWLNSV